MQPLKIFIGYDHRQPVALTALMHSIYSQSSKPVSITPLVLDQLPLKRTGLTPFTFSRFLVPWLCDYKGWALFLDIDIILNDDISKIFDLADEQYNVLVSKNEKRFEWASVMLFNCAKNQILTPEYVESTKLHLHTIEWCDDEEIGSIPPEWNHLVGYDKPRDDAKLVHYTQGIPCFPQTENSEYKDLWVKHYNNSRGATSWEDLMGQSIHAAGIKNGNVHIKVPVYYMNDNKTAVLAQYEDKVKSFFKEAENGNY
jgi:hypothetical protein